MGLIKKESRENLSFGKKKGFPEPFPKKTKRASLYTLGCRLNQSETALLEERLREAGYAIVPFGETADLGVINTCTVTREADAKARKAIRGFIRRNPHAFTAVIGCYSERDFEALADVKGIDLVIGTQEKLSVLDYVSEGKNETRVVVRNPIERGDFTIKVAGGPALARRANLKIQDGCNFRCSYCVVPAARGSARSRAMDNLLDEAALLVKRGVKEIVLTGVNIGTFRYQGQTLLDVVNRLAEIRGLERIRISSTEPSAVPDGLWPLMNDPHHALAPFLHVPVQSGSNKILELMRRRYTRDRFLNFIRQAADAVPDLCIGTDVMVGFPGEGEREFEETCALLEEGPIAYAHVFKYSERAGTLAAAFPDKVDPKTQNRRSARIRRISAQKRRCFHETHLGRVLDVLFEEKVNGYWFGYTGNYIRVAARSDRRLENEIRSVRLEKVRGDIVIGSLDDT